MSAALDALCEPILADLGYDLVEIEMSPKGRMLRIFIDTLNGVPIHVEDCTRATHALQDVFERENIDYDRLEVSSPGVDRVLNRQAHFERFNGLAITLRLKEPVAQRQVFEATLCGADANSIEIELEGTRHRVLMANIKKARLVPVLDWKSVENTQ